MAVQEEYTNSTMRRGKERNVTRNTQSDNSRMTSRKGFLFICFIVHLNLCDYTFTQLHQQLTNKCNQVLIFHAG